MWTRQHYQTDTVTTEAIFSVTNLHKQRDVRRHSHGGAAVSTEAGVVALAFICSGRLAIRETTDVIVLQGGAQLMKSTWYGIIIAKCDPAAPRRFPIEVPPLSGSGGDGIVIYCAELYKMGCSGADIANVAS
ncbi:hypothetical protein HPB48_026773 [Haemaphysalis longicornis]|uniref:Uncharacterized protein n=1 Tax=Haemaphysalis longicornis TaxID=44386 RepID=A0A9J6HD18_HAELO|nr:hypothetical protein HPB48_026773 [Haemaphysalis longicornis]